MNIPAWAQTSEVITTTAHSTFEHTMIAVIQFLKNRNLISQDLDVIIENGKVTTLHNEEAKEQPEEIYAYPEPNSVPLQQK